MKGRDSTTNTEFDPVWSCYDGPEGGVAAPDAGVDAGDAPTRLRDASSGHPSPRHCSATPRSTCSSSHPPWVRHGLHARVFDGDAGTVSFPGPRRGSPRCRFTFTNTCPPIPRYTVAEVFEYGLPVLAGGDVEGFVMLKASQALLR